MLLELAFVQQVRDGELERKPEGGFDKGPAIKVDQHREVSNTRIFTTLMLLQALPPGSAVHPCGG